AVPRQLLETAVDGFGRQPHERDQVHQPFPSKRLPSSLIVVDETGRETRGFGQPGLAPALPPAEKLENDPQIGVNLVRHASIPPEKMVRRQWCRQPGVRDTESRVAGPPRRLVSPWKLQLDSIL